MTFLVPLAAALPDYPGFFESIGYQTSGLVVVFTSLGAIWLIMECLGAFFRRLPSKAPEEALEQASADGGLTPAVVAVIAAAVHEMVHGNVRIVAIMPIEGPGDGRPPSAWSGEGRRSVFASHKVR